jgi:hypothetical protein
LNIVSLDVLLYGCFENQTAVTPDDCEIFSYDAHRQHILLSGTDIVQIRGAAVVGSACEDENGDNPRALVIRTGNASIYIYIYTASIVFSADII